MLTPTSFPGSLFSASIVVLNDNGGREERPRKRGCAYRTSSKHEGSRENSRQLCNSNNNNNNSELYLHDCNNTALQKRPKHDNYSNLVIRVQLQH